MCIDETAIMNEQLDYTKSIKLDRAHPYPIARRALNSAMGTTIGLALIGACCCLFCSCFGIIFAKKALVHVKEGDMEAARKMVHASYACTISGIVLFAVCCVVFLLVPIVTVRIIYLSHDHDYDYRT